MSVCIIILYYINYYRVNKCIMSITFTQSIYVHTIHFIIFYIYKYKQHIEIHYILHTP